MQGRSSTLQYNQFRESRNYDHILGRLTKCDELHETVERELANGYGRLFSSICGVSRATGRTVVRGTDITQLGAHRANRDYVSVRLAKVLEGRTGRSHQNCAHGATNHVGSRTRQS